MNEEKEKDWRRLRSPLLLLLLLLLLRLHLLLLHLLFSTTTFWEMKGKKKGWNDGGMTTSIIQVMMMVMRMRSYQTLTNSNTTTKPFSTSKEKKRKKKKKKKKKSATLRGRLSTETRWYGYVLMLSMGTTKVPARGTRADVLKKKKTSCSRGMPCVRTRTDLRF